MHRIHNYRSRKISKSQIRARRRNCHCGGKQPNIKKLSTLFDEELFEIEMSKKDLKLNLPIQIGYFILQYAKLHMLQFYCDLIDRFVDRADFEYYAMDTDFAYMLISGSTYLYGNLFEVRIIKLVHLCHNYIFVKSPQVLW